MYRYVVALCQGGLQEDPEWHHEFWLLIDANNRKDAIKRWSLYYRMEEHLDMEQETYWGWSIDIILTTDPFCKTVDPHGGAEHFQKYKETLCQ
jgi:hypothetical protein